MEYFDLILAGGGAAGLGLAYYMVNSPLKDHSILIIDKEAKNKNDRTWCYWIDHPTPLNAIAYRSWNYLKFTSDTFERIFDISPYRYYMIRGIDFYEHMRQELSKFPKVRFVQGKVEQIKDGEEAAEVIVNGVSYSGKWVFDSLLQPAQLHIDPTRYHDIKQHFKGWEIETDWDVFDPEVMTLFDFRTPQKDSMRFVYVLPFSTRRALVEYTIFSAKLLTEEEYDDGINDYLRNVLGITQYRRVAEEKGIIPMTDQPFPRRGGKRILFTGTKGGRVKPSTGYAFQRIQQDSEAIVRSLLKYGDPFHLPESPWVFRMSDSVMLQLMYRRGNLMKPIFTQLFRNNPIRRIFRFLDEEASPVELLLFITSLSPLPFLQALLKLIFFRRV